MGRWVFLLGLGITLTLGSPRFSSPEQGELEVADDLSMQAAALIEKGSYREALPIVQQVLDIREKALGPHHPDLASSLNNLAGLYQDLRDYAKAEPLYKRALEILESALGPYHPDVAASLNNLGMLYQDSKEYLKAEPLYKRALEIWERALGPEHPDLTASLNNLAGLYQVLGDYARAEPLFLRALKIWEKAPRPDEADAGAGRLTLYADGHVEGAPFRPEPSNAAITLNNLARLYRELGDHARAEPFFLRALETWEKALGPDHPKVAAALNNLGLLYRDMRDYAKAEPLCRRALEIMEKAFGPDHPAVAAGLSNLAGIYKALGDYGRAGILYTRAHDLCERRLGSDHPDVAASLSNLAGLAKALGDPAGAEPLYQRALQILEKVSGPDHPSVATGLNNLAMLYQDSGDYGKAEPLHRRALGIREKALGPDHLDLATTLHNLAALCYYKADYAGAEPLYLRALGIWERTLGADHLHVALTASDLAMLYQDAGDYDRAKPLHLRALEIREKTLGPDHPDVAANLNNLAGLYKALGDYAKAAPLYKRALEIREKALGPDDAGVAASLTNLAGLYQAMGDHNRSGPLYERAVLTFEKTLGPDHPNVAANLNTLAGVYESAGDHARAEPLYKRALLIWEKAFGPDHPSVADTLHNLAMLLARTQRPIEAYELFRRAQDIDDKLIDRALGLGTEAGKTGFLAARGAVLDAFLSLINQSLSNLPFARREGLNVWMRRRGAALEARKRFHEALFNSDDREERKAFHGLAMKRAQISSLVFSMPGKEGPDAYRDRIAALEKEKEGLEAELGRISRAFATWQKMARPDAEKVAQALPAGSALVEFTKVDLYDFLTKGEERRWLPPRYLAFVLPAGKGEDVGMVDLGDAQEIDALVHEIRYQMPFPREGAEEEIGLVSGSLYWKVFEPLKKELGAARDVFIAPDGDLNLIPFEILQGTDGRYLIEDYTFNYLGSGREILAFGEGQRKGGKALLIGDPDFDLGAQEKDSAPEMPGLEAEGEDGAGGISGTTGYPFLGLPGTREEVETIHSLLGEAELFTGKEALESVLTQKGAPRILHMATHALSPGDLDPGRIGDGERRLRPLDPSPDQAGGKGRPENPLLRYGLALAGANETLKAGDPERCEGLVTAEKILGLRLRGTDMVVLSLRGAGFGDAEGGEGVYYLRSAFTRAGAKSLVMSMWGVPDKETQELMAEFYTNMLSRDMNRCQALRQAALKEMKVVKERYGESHPVYWGAFVFLGEP